MSRMAFSSRTAPHCGSTLEAAKSQEPISTSPSPVWLGIQAHQGMKGNENMPKKRSRSLSMDDDGVAEKRAVLEGAREDARRALEAQKAAALSQTPDGFNDMFGQIGFTRHKDQWFPCLILSPYDVPPGQIRNDWLKLLEKLKSKGQLNYMSHIVYWYGHRAPDPLYGFIYKSNFVSFEESQSKKYKKKCYDSLMNARGKGTLGRWRSSVLARAVVEVEEDLTRARYERKWGNYPFKEGWESLTLEDVDTVLGLPAMDVERPSDSGLEPCEESNDTMPLTSESDTGPSTVSKHASTTGPAEPIPAAPPPPVAATLASSTSNNSSSATSATTCNELNPSLSLDELIAMYPPVVLYEIGEKKY